MQSATSPSDRAATGAAAHAPERCSARLRIGQWLPPLMLAGGLLLGAGLWAEWGPVIALGRVISHCF
jgi:hypothetical protein